MKKNDSLYYSKYLKYKNKYLELKNNFYIGGMIEETTKTSLKSTTPELEPKEIALEKVLNQVVDPTTGNLYNNAYITNKIIDYYEKYVKPDRNIEALDYIRKNRLRGNKIMLINGAIPLQESKFVIPAGYVLLYCEQDIKLMNYFGFSVNKRNEHYKKLITKSFDEYPLLITDILYENGFQGLFDLIIFDSGTVYWMNLDKTILLKLFALTHDNSSIIVIDNMINANPITQNESDIIIQRNKFPMYYHFTSITVIKNSIMSWFEQEFKNKSNIYEIDSNEFLNLLLYEPPKNDNKLHVIFYSKNIFHTNDKNLIYIYFTNTKNVL